jgi:hypothetical protein
MEKELQQLLEELGEAINSSLSESGRFAAAMAEMEQAGYDAYVILEASIGFRTEGTSQSGQADIHVPPQPQVCRHNPRCRDNPSATLSASTK